MPAQQPTVLLVDAFNVLYRSYHGMPPLTHNGMATGAIYGTMKKRNQLRAIFGPIPQVWVFDRIAVPGEGGKSGIVHSATSQSKSRTQVFPQYKANRASMPEDLKLQCIPLAQGLMHLGHPVWVGSETAEGDDVIATLATRLESTEIVGIVTSDKDCAQLVSERVAVIPPDLMQALWPDGIFEKFGVHPHQIPDYLALLGDSADNIPGVPKWGAKTAAKWLQKFQSLEGILANRTHIPGVVGQMLEQHADWARVALELTKVKKDLLLPENWETYCKEQPVGDLDSWKESFGIRTSFTP